MLRERLIEYSRALFLIDAESLLLMAEKLRLIRTRKNTVYIAGNGGSCANAAHLTLHLREVNFRAVDLTADSACLTAIANDYSYAEVFSRLFEFQAVFGDALIVISGSSRSPNILSVLQKAESLQRDISILGLLGSRGGEALQYCQSAVVLEMTEYGPVEVAHDACIHLLKELLP
jgi:phosphoheptose isomerase